LGEGATEVLALFADGSSAGLDGGLGLEVAFLLRTGREVSICLDRGLVLVDAYSLARQARRVVLWVFLGSLWGNLSMRTQSPQSPEVLILWSCSSLQTLE